MPPSLNGELNRIGQLLPSSLNTIHLVFPIGGLMVSTVGNSELNMPVPHSNFSISPSSLALQTVLDVPVGRVL